MPKIKTPIRYESKLQALNELGVLTLHDEVKQTIQMPVSDERPVDSSGTAAGRFLQCTNSSALSTLPKKGFSSVEYMTYELDMLETQVTLTFSQVVKRILLRSVQRLGTSDIDWVSLDDAVIFMEIRTDIWLGSAFHSDIIRFNSSGIPAWAMEVQVYGFY